MLEVYNSVHNLDIIALSETILDSTISNDQLITEGFSDAIYGNDHPSTLKLEGFLCIIEKGCQLSVEKRLSCCKK